MIEIIVKPEALLLCEAGLKKFLSQNGFNVVYKKRVADWNNLSILLYEKSDKVTRRQLELQNVARSQIMGNIGSEAEVWGMDCDEMKTEMEAYERLTELKRKYRNEKWKEGLSFHIEYLGEYSEYHFTYFHVPDLEIDTIRNEQLLWGRFTNEVGNI